MAFAEDRATAMAEEPPTRSVLLRVHRHNPAVPGDVPRVVEYRVPLTKGLTVLDALLQVKEQQEPGLAFRYSCRMGICGSCGMLINGQPRLACELQIDSLGTDAIEIGPLPGYPLIRDAATDFREFFRRHAEVKPYLVRPENGGDAPVEKEFLQSEAEKLAYYQFSMCIMCGLCNAACPIALLDREFLGPQALAQAYRFTADSRDRGWRERVDVVDSPRGCWRCELAGSCSVVCPKGVDPSLGVQLLKRETLRRRFFK